MFILPVLLVAVVGVTAWSVLHHHHPVAAGADGRSEAVHHRPVLPTTPLGWVGFAAAILAVVNVALVNVIQVPFLGIGLLAATAAAAALARFVQHDRSVVVLAVVLASAAALLGWLLFLGGEVLIGHD